MRRLNEAAIFSAEKARCLSRKPPTIREKSGVHRITLVSLQAKGTVKVENRLGRSCPRR